MIDPDALREIGRRVRRLNHDRLNPEAFHIEKDEIAHCLERMASRTQTKHARRSPQDERTGR